VENIVFDVRLLEGGGYGAGPYGAGGYGTGGSFADRKVSCVFIVGHNFTSSVVCRFQGNATDAWGSPSLNELLTYNAGVMVKFFTEAEHDYYRIYIDDSAGGNTQPEIGRVFFGTYFEPTRNPSIDFGYQVIDLSIRGESAGGAIHFDPRTKKVRASMNFKALPQTDKYDSGKLLDIFKTVGRSRDLFVSIDPDNYPNKLAIYGVIVSDLQFTALPNNLQSVPLTIEELV
jgi:hypothetical protein